MPWDNSDIGEWTGYAFNDRMGGWRPVFGEPVPIKKGRHKGSWWVRSAGLRKRWIATLIRLKDGTRLEKEEPARLKKGQCKKK